MIPYFYFSVIQTSFKSLDCFMIYSEACFKKGIDGQNNVLLNHMKKNIDGSEVIQNKNQFTGSQIA